jgi:hypothetical protein
MDDQNLPQEPQEETTTSENSEENRAMILINMESMIKSHITSIDQLSQEYQKHKSMLDDVFENDETYRDHASKAKEANKLKAGTKQQIMKQPAVADLSNKVKTMKSEISELEGALSDYLQQYQQMSGINEIEGEDGELREIVYVAKLVKRSNSKR